MAFDSINLKEFSPWATGTLIAFDDGEERLKINFTDFDGKEKDDYHTVQIDDRLTQIAYDFYKDKIDLPHRYWFVIAMANDVIRNPLDITGLVGKKILIPNILDAILIIRQQS